MTLTKNKTTTMIIAALMAALTCVGTMIIRIPTPTGGYIHPGDGFVLLSGLLLGPLWGFLAAGLGSALTDFIGGYMVFVPGTFVIKGLTALTAVVLYRAFDKFTKSLPEAAKLIISGLVGEAVMVLGYFLYEILLLAESFTGDGIIGGVVASAAGIPANIIQAVFGVIIATILYPILQKIQAN